MALWNPFVMSFFTKKVLALLMFGFLGCNHVYSSKFLIPEKYRGLIVVEFGMEGKPELQVKDGYYIFRIPENGLLQTSSKFLGGTSKPFQYYYYSNRSNIDIEKLKPIDAYSETKNIWSDRNGIVKCRNRTKQHTQFAAFVVSPNDVLISSSENICSFIQKHDPNSFN